MYNNTFFMNGYLWSVIFVNPHDPRLVDRTNSYCVATTDPITKHVYLANTLYGDFLNRVLIHELGHCAMFSYYLIDDIHELVHPNYWVYAEEWMCNLLADYSYKIFSVAYHLLGDDAWIHTLT